MKNILVILAVGIMLLHISCNNSTKNLTNYTSNNKCELDSLLSTVDKDKYGMQKYIIAYLKRGPNRDRSTEEAASLQKAHMAKIDKMAKDGKLVLAGPFLDDGDTRGIYVFNVTTIEEAQALTASDPAIQAGSLEMELVPWYGSAALQTLNYMHYKLEEKKINAE